MILKTEQYKIIREYFLLNENLDFDSFKSFVNDLEKMDLDKQKDTIQQLQKFIYKKIKEINKKKKISTEKDFYELNKDIIEKMKGIIKDSYLKKLHKIFNMNRFNLKLNREYINYLSKKTYKNLNFDLENYLDILLDSVFLTWSSNSLNYYSILKVSLTIKQKYQYTDETFFDIRINSTLPYDQKTYKTLKIYSEFEDINIQEDNITLEKLNLIIKKLIEKLDQLQLIVDIEQYNL